MAVRPAPLDKRIAGHLSESAIDLILKLTGDNCDVAALTQYVKTSVV